MKPSEVTLALVKLLGNSRTGVGRGVCRERKVHRNSRKRRREERRENGFLKDDITLVLNKFIQNMFITIPAVVAYRTAVTAALITNTTIVNLCGYKK
jgi:hypothetical protein